MFVMMVNDIMGGWRAVSANIVVLKGALDKYNIVTNFFPKKLGFLYH